ncbi:CsgG/HfaB family protein [Candidatus Bipolaricaulota bacterium]
MLGVVSVAAVALPDLVVTEIDVEPSVPQPGELVLIEATISNHGTSTAETPFFVHFFLDGQEIAIRSISGNIEPDRVKRVSTEWLAIVGSHTLTVEADPSIGRIDESDEANNVTSRPLNVPLGLETEAAIRSLKIVVASFEDVTGSGFLHVGEGVADKLVERLAGTGVRVLERSEFESIMQERSLNPSLTSDAALAGRLLGADVVITGSVTELDVRDTTLQLGFLSVSEAEVNVHLSASLVNVHSSEIMNLIPAEGHNEGTTGFSLDLGGFLSFLETESPDICGGGLQTTRSWYNVAESIPIAYHNPGAAEWLSIEITTGIGSFVKWLGWKYVDADDCGVWYWDQLSIGGFQMSSGIYSARIWDGTAYVAEVTFQIRPGLSLTIPPFAEITVGTDSFEETVVGSALNFAVDDLLAGLFVALEDASPILAEERESSQSAHPMAYAREGQIAAVLPDGRIAINIGSSSGVSLGDSFEVLDVLNVIIDPQTLDILDYDTLGVNGTIVITEVRERVSFAVLTSDFEPVVGNIVRWLAP